MSPPTGSFLEHVRQQHALPQMARHVPDTVLSPGSHLTLTRETEAQRGEVTGPRSQDPNRQRQGQALAVWIQSLNMPSAPLLGPLTHRRACEPFTSYLGLESP